MRITPADAKRMVMKPAMMTPQSIMALQRTPLRTKGTTPGQNMAECFNPIFDKVYGCASPNNVNKASCVSDRLRYALECFFLGKTPTNTSYYIDLNNAHISCDKKTGYTFDETKNLLNCANTSGYVTNNICDLSSRPSQGTEPVGTYPFCDCEGSSHDASDQPRPFKAHKIWNAGIQQCECDQSSLYKFLSQDSRCCGKVQCLPENNEEYSCEDEDCICKDGYTKINQPGHPEDGKCILPCSTTTQNNLINLSTGQAGCKTPETIEIINSYMIGKLDDLCCQNNTCVQETTLSSAKLLCVNNTPKCTWLVPTTGMYSCPRAGSPHFMSCDKNEMPVGVNQYEYMCGIDIASFDGLLGCSKNQCETDCNTKCQDKGKVYQSANCTGTQPNPSQYPDLYSGNCACQCVDP